MAAAALLVVVAAVVVAAKAGHHSARPTRVQPAQLGGLLLSANDIGAVMGAPGIVIDYASDGLTPLADSISDDKCRGTLHGLQPPVYEGSGYTAVNAQTLRDPSGTSWVQQAVVGYPWAAVARKFLKQSTTDWKSCAGQSVTLTGQGATQRWVVGDVTAVDDLITQESSKEAGKGWACQHALKAASNVIIDVTACSFDVTNQAAGIADTIAARIGH